MPPMPRPPFALLLISLLSFGCSASGARTPATDPAFVVVETSIGDLRRAMEEGRTTSRGIVQQYLTRIAL
jgi:hypothetical protein